MEYALNHHRTLSYLENSYEYSDFTVNFLTFLWRWEALPQEPIIVGIGCTSTIVLYKELVHQLPENDKNCILTEIYRCRESSIPFRSQREWSKICKLIYIKSLQ